MTWPDDRESTLADAVDSENGEGVISLEDLYLVLQVPRSADRRSIQNAYRRLSGRDGLSPQPSNDVQARLDAAYSVLGDPQLRADYDQTLIATKQPASAATAEPTLGQDAGHTVNHAVPVADTPLELPAQLGESEFTGEPAAQAQAASASRKQLPGFLVPMAGLALFALTAIASAGTVLLTRHGTSYPLDLADADYDLESMTLRQADLPAGIHLVQSQGFNNDEWAQVVGQDDPAAKKRQLDAQGRVRSFVAYFTWDDPSGHLGKTISVTAESDLFINEPDAKAGASGLCASLVGGADPPVEFAVSGLGDQSSGFFVTEIQQNFGRSVDTVVCFRTGRIVHGVIETGLEGTQKVAVAVRLAQRMLQHVDETFSGHPVPKELPPIQAPSTPPPSQSPSSGPSPKPSP